MVITYPINSQQANTLFADNAVMMSGSDVIFDYRAAELFGPEVCTWAENCMGSDSYLSPGKDWNSWGAGKCRYFTRSGFSKLVSHHNYLICVKEYDMSEGGKIWNDLWQARCERMDAADAEEERKREERRAKREAARRAKQEAQREQQAAE